MPKSKSSGGRSKGSKATASPAAGGKSSNSPVKNNKNAHPKPPTASVTNSARGPPRPQSQATNVSKARPLSNGAPNPPAANSRPPMSATRSHSTKDGHDRSPNQFVQGKGTGGGTNKLQKAQAPPANSPSKQTSPNAGKLTSSTSKGATAPRPISGGPTSANNFKPGPPNPRATGNQSNVTEAHGNKGERKTSQHQSVGQASAKSNENNKQAHPQNVQGRPSARQTSSISQASKQQSSNQERSPPHPPPTGHNPTTKKIDRPRSTLTGTQDKFASPTRVLSHVSQNLNKGPSHSHPLQETSPKSNNNKAGATHMHQRDDRSARRGDIPSSIESMPRANPIHQTESKIKSGRVSGVEAPTARLPDVLRSKRTSSHSTAVNSGSSQRSSSTFAQDQSTTSGLPATKRPPTHAQSTNVTYRVIQDVANSKHSSSHTATPVRSSSHSQATKKETVNRKQGATKTTKSQPAVAQTQTAGILSRISSLVGWAQSKPPVTVRATDKPVLATNPPVSNVKKESKERPLARPPTPTYQAPKSNKGNTSQSVRVDTYRPSPGPSKSRDAQPLKSVNSTAPKNEPVPPSQRAKRVSIVVENRSAKPVNAGISTGETGWSQWAMRLFAKKATPPKAETVANRKIGASTPTGNAPILSSGTSHMSAKSGPSAGQQKSASDHATNGSGESSKRQPVQGSMGSKAARVTPVHHSKIVTRSSPSKVFSGPSNRSVASRHKISLRRYSRTLAWRDTDRPRILSALATETAAPLPSPPKNELRNKVARRTIAKNPHLFRITTPIKVDRFEKLLKNHPNPGFVASVCRGLRDGFWPYADTSDPSLPTTLDKSQPPILDKDKATFVRQQRDEEIKLGRWSESFGKKLLPGMYSSPIRAVPKHKPGTYRMVNDQSQGEHSLNSMIPKSQVKVKLDDIHDLGTALIAVRKKHGAKKKLTVFKSDVKGAYRLLPMHPLWQIRQVATVDGKRYVDRCNTFGNRAGGWIWDSFISLVLWIGKEEKKLPDLFGYVDDDFSWEFAKKKRFYKPYGKYLPTKQARYLELWDELGIPHEEDKQLHGSSLPIIGFEVDPNAMRVSLPAEKKAKVVGLIREVAHDGKTCTLEQLQSVAGSINSVLSLYPHLRPRLRTLFDEMAGKEGARTKLRVTKPIARKLQGLADYLEQAGGVPIRKVVGK